MLRIAVPFLRSLFLCLDILIRITRHKQASQKQHRKKCLNEKLFERSEFFYLGSRMFSFERSLVKTRFFGSFSSTEKDNDLKNK